MYNDGGGRSTRRQEGDAAYEADVDSKRGHSRQALRPSPKVAPQYPQHAPLLGSKRPPLPYEERNGRGGGYGAVAPPEATPTTSSTPMASITWIQQAQQFFQPYANKHISQDPQKPPYGQPMYQHSWQHHNAPPPPPPPLQHLPLDKQQLVPHHLFFDSTLYYSDEEEDLLAYNAPTHRPPIREFSTTSGPLNRDIETYGSNDHIRTVPKNNGRKVTVKVGKADESSSTHLGGKNNNNHRRNNSDFVYEKQANHRRSNSAELWARKGQEGHNYHDGVSIRDRSPLPLHPFNRKSTPTTPRARSFSAGGMAKPNHRRADSNSSVGSIASILSERSIVSDISKSALYKKVTNTGKVTFHAPADKVRLVMDKDLQPGHLYRLQGGDDEEERFFQYTLQSEDLVDFPLTEGGCGCECISCAKCQYKMDQLLYPSLYVLRVEDDLYQRVISEISDSKQPCGLFFCGHHEDTDKPSILIAVVIIAAFFGGLLIVTFLGQGG